MTLNHPAAGLLANHDCDDARLFTAYSVTFDVFFDHVGLA